MNQKIWNFYKKMMNENGLMIWKVGNLSQSWDAGNGAALDGDIDAAAALAMAYYQFGDEKYKEDAKKLIQSMKKSEFESNGLHLPGDKWGDAAYNRKNPGYFDPAYMPVFALIDTDNAEFWNKTAYDANMKLYEASSAEVTTGLIDDWTDKNGKSEDDYYGFVIYHQGIDTYTEILDDITIPAGTNVETHFYMVPKYEFNISNPPSRFVHVTLTEHSSASAGENDGGIENVAGRLPWNSILPGPQDHTLAQFYYVTPTEYTTNTTENGVTLVEYGH